MAKDTGQASSQATGTGPVGKEGYTVKQGECVESIAFEHGLFWETVWNDPKNSELKEIRKNPNALLPGDKIYVRDLEEKEEPCQAEQKHRFRRKAVPSVLRLRLLDDGEPRANQPYTLEIDGEVFSGTTDGDGKLEQTVMPGAKEGKLSVGEGEQEDEYVVKLRHLDPVGEVSGAQARLASLGYDPGEIDGQMTPETQAALQQFQVEQGLSETGELDQETIRKLEELYGG